MSELVDWSLDSDDEIRRKNFNKALGLDDMELNDEWETRLFGGGE